MSTGISASISHTQALDANQILHLAVGISHCGTEQLRTLGGALVLVGYDEIKRMIGQ